MKVPNWLAVTVAMFGGWFSTMSGAVSIPFALAALFWAPKLLFAILAFVGLFITAISAAWHHHKSRHLWGEERLQYEERLATVSESYERKIDALTVRLDDRQKVREKELERQMAKQGLGTWRSRLSARIKEVSDLNCYGYNNKYRDALPGRYDSDTIEIVEGAAEFLAKNFSLAEQAFFLSKEGLVMSEGVTDEERKWRAVLDHLHQHARQLDKIIEQHLA